MVQRSDSTSICNNIKTEYSVVCGNKSGTLHTDRLGSGSKGKCIHCDSSEYKWFTPKEFEKFGGRETSKDWKRSVKLDGKPFYFYLNSGELKIHAFNCYCQICIGDSGTENGEPAGPIKFFSPPNRKRRADEEFGMPSMVSKSGHTSNQNSGFDSDSNDMSQLLSLISQSIDSAGNFDSSSGELQNSTHVPPACSKTAAVDDQPCELPKKTTADHISDKAQSIEDKLSSLGSMLDSLKSEVVSLKQLVRQFETEPSRVNGFKSSVTENLADALNQPEASRSRKPEDSGHCANCNRPAPFKCGRCNLVRYCSEFCQQRDWPIHNRICGAKFPISADLRVRESMSTHHASTNNSATQPYDSASGESSSDSKDGNEIFNGCDQKVNSPIEIKCEPIEIVDD